MSASGPPGWLTHWPWVALFLLGAFHGLNPGMGWLFAVALGLQERRRVAVWRALPPIVLGHLLSVGLIVALLQVIRAGLPPAGLRVGAALILVSFGALRLWRAGHPRWVGMQVGFRDLTVWSFLMASGHGAGLMLMPIVLALPGNMPSSPMHHAGMGTVPLALAALTHPHAWLAPVAVHTLGYLVFLALIAVIVYEKLGISILRRAWFNLDFVWAVALVTTGILTLFL